MSRFLGIVFVIIVTFYDALIYDSESFLILGFAEISILVLLLLYQCLLFGKINVSVETPLEIAGVNQKVPIDIFIRNRSIFPAGKICIKVGEENIISGKKVCAKFSVTVRGADWRKQENCSITKIHTYFEAKNIGKMKISVKRVWVFDLLGFLSFPVLKKNRTGQNEIIILPKQYSVPIEVGKNLSEFAPESNQYIQDGLQKELNQSVEIRNYQPGDKIRSIHWKLSAKMDDLMVQEQTATKTCPVLVYLDMQDERMQGKKKIRKRDTSNAESFLTILLSLSESLIQNECIHYIIWYDTDKGETVRYLVAESEDVYTVFFALDAFWMNSEKICLEEEYRQKYHEKQQTKKIVLNKNLQIICNDSQIYEYAEKDLKEQLLSQVIIL